ncbi:MAG: hypothetical protein DRN12_07015 [Thermoplasmata archaeon]|nr:MAG: hypothetical protein DRN12_07015 [Thermoplasmata archaeon]
MAVVILLIVTVFFISNYYGDVEALENVDVSVESVYISRFGLTDCTFILTLNISNPSSHDISSLSSNFEIFVENISIGYGNFSGVDIKAYTAVRKDISVIVVYSSVAEAAVNTLRNIWKGGSPTVEIKGEISGSILFGLTTFSYPFIASK